MINLVALGILMLIYGHYMHLDQKDVEKSNKWWR